MTRRHEFTITAVLSILAAGRILVFCAAFPVFAQVDEEMHFDLVLRYARGQLPHNFDLIAPESLNWIVPYASPEFLRNPQDLADHKFPPPLWKQSGPEADAIAAATRSEWSKEINWECSQPPVYYCLGAVWWKLGRLLGVDGISAVYWLRFLNGALIAALVWLAFLAACSISPGNPIFRIGVPFVVAFFPQDAFFLINNDVLSAVCGGLIFMCASRLLTATSTSFPLAVVSGLALAAAYLTKISNAPLVAVAFVTMTAKILWNSRSQLQRSVFAIAALCFSVVTPIAIWTNWTRTHFGDFTGSSGKAALLGWTAKSFPEWWSHPIFSLHGFWLFWSDFAPRFWRGELMWHGGQIYWPPMDIYYAVLSLAVVAIAAIGLCRGNGLGRRTMGLALFSFLASIGLLIVISVAFDFGRCIYPSRAFPYLTAGRLIIGALVPFAALFVYASTSLLERLSAKLTVAAIIVTIGLATTSQVILDSRVFSSEHNWLHRGTEPVAIH